MQVETFKVSKEVDASGATPLDSECIALIEKLGLKGQQTLIHTSNDEADAKLCPYRKMTADEAVIYTLLCPQRTPLSDYKDEAVPLRILQVAAHATDYFKLLEVWHPRNADVKDPVLVGRENAYTSEVFILGRWGKVLDSLDALRQQASIAYRKQCTAALIKIKTQIEADLDRVNGDSNLLSGFMPTYYFRE